MKRFVWLAAIFMAVLTFAAGEVGYSQHADASLNKESGINSYRVICDRDAFKSSSYRYLPGMKVTVSFPLIATDTDYSFQVDGVENYSTHYSTKEGYVIEFVMPANDVKLSYRAKNTMEKELVAPVDKIEISLRENPSTGFLWYVSVSPEGLIELTDDYYVSDKNDEKYPVCGLGGTHFWKFKVVGKGMAEITCVSRRGESELDRTIVYQYRCDGETATLVDTK